MKMGSKKKIHEHYTLLGAKLIYNSRTENQDDTCNQNMLQNPFATLLL